MAEGVSIVTSLVAIVISLWVLWRDDQSRRRELRLTTLDVLGDVYASLSRIEAKDPSGRDDFIQALDRAELICPDHPRLLRYRGYRARFDGDGVEAVRCFRAAVAKDRRAGSGKVDLAWQITNFPDDDVGTDERRRRDAAFAEAETLLREARTDERSRISAEVVLCGLLTRMGRTEEAAVEISAAIERSPGRTDLRKARANLLLALDRHEDAVTDLKIAVSCATSNEVGKALLDLSDAQKPADPEEALLVSRAAERFMPEGNAYAHAMTAAILADMAVDRKRPDEARLAAAREGLVALDATLSIDPRRLVFVGPFGRIEESTEVELRAALKDTIRDLTVSD